MNSEIELIRSELDTVCPRITEEAVAGCCRELGAAARVFVAGAGRSGFMASAFAMRLVHLGYAVHVVGEATAPAFAEGDVLVGVSGSGNTSGTVRAAGEARRAGGRVVAVTTDVDSELAAAADAVLLVPAATKNRAEGETATAQPLSSLFDQAVHLALDAVCLRLAAEAGVDNAAARGAHVKTE
ncbi:6-phospho-3-hexuloisomerase [Actinopolyspora halophila]|uniref:6-phospho-3-hexuloisomerase n=1 Tax=Actinopolyspora halophila TaxID=1850 RepID=UPI00036CAEEA|nr:6-phospho-3-hexuloisomerase [Actinopolyspora halophila]